MLRSWPGRRRLFISDFSIEVGLKEATIFRIERINYLKIWDIQMRCPNCGKENTANSEICNSCSFVLPSSSTNECETKTKTSKFAIIGLIFLVLGSILSSVSMAFSSIQIVILTTVLPVIFGIKSLVDIKKGRGRIKGKALAVFEIVVPICLAPVCIFWSMDAALIPNDYTIADFRSAPREYNCSFDLLMKLSEEEKDLPDAPLIGLSVEDINTITIVNTIIGKEDFVRIKDEVRTHSENIYLAWKNGRKGRDIISELDAFQEIADLTEITALTESDQDITYGFLRNLRHIAYLYQSYIYLEIAEGDEKTVINELIKLDSVFRKFSINARSSVSKLLCIAGLATDIRTANFLANNPRIPEESLVLLAEHFRPLNNAHTSFRNPLLFEYLTTKKTLDAVFHEDMHERPSMLKRNSAARLFRNFCDRWTVVSEGIEGFKRPELSVWPAICPNWLHVKLDSEGNVPGIYKYYNPVGSLLVGILVPAIERIFEIKTKLEIHDDLLQIVLNRRLRKEIRLNARAYSDQYIVDVEEKRIFSPGPDGEANTEDDIKLTINPQVLKWNH